VHGSTLPQPVMMGPRHTKAHPAHTRKALSPVHRGLSVRSTRWNHGIVYLPALSSKPIHFQSSKSLKLHFSCPHSHLLFSSGKHTVYLPPGSRACLKTHNRQTADSDSSSSCCLPTCIFTIPSSPLPFIKSIAVPAYPVVRSCSRQRLPIPPRSIYSLPPTTSHVPIP
jgi:hypothetical protein